MAPRANRQNSKATRKRGESDANEPPKRRKTRHSKNDSEDKEIIVDEREGGDVKGKRGARKVGRQAKKARYVPSYSFSMFPPRILFLRSLLVFTFYFFLSLFFIIYLNRFANVHYSI